MDKLAPARAVDPPPGGVLVGRQRELEELSAGLADALAQRGRLLMLVGEPGIGKTRLAEEIASLARQQGAKVLWGRCWEDEGAPAFWPWVQVLRLYIQECDAAALRDTLGPGASDIARLVPEIEQRLPDLPQASTLEPAQARFRLFDSVSTFLKTAASSQPLVLILDDLHWADTPSLLLLQFLAREMREVRLLVVGTYRDVDLQRHDPLAAAIGKLARDSRCIALRGLNESEVAQLIESAWGATPPPSLVVAVHQRTEGNPFFVSEMVRLLASETRPTHAAELVAWVQGVPHGVRQTILCRLDQLAESQRRLLSIASVIGREFSVELLERVAGEAARGQLLAGLDAARAIGALTELPPAGGRYRFSHALVRETLYDDVPTAERLHLHEQIGAALEALTVGNAEPHLAELAHHFFFACTAGGPVAKAVDYAMRAGDQCNRRLAYEEAAKQYQLAVQAHTRTLMAGNHGVEGAEPALVRQHCELMLALGQAQFRAGDVTTGRETFAAVADYARRTSSADVLGRAALGVAGRWGVRSGIDPAALALLEEAAAALGEEVNAVHVEVASRLAMALRLSGVQERSVRLGEEAVQLGRVLGEPVALAYALDALRFVQWRPENSEERLVIAAEIAALLEQTSDIEMVLWNRLARLIALLELGDMPQVDAEIRAQAQMAAELRQPFYRWIAVVHRAMQALLEGRFEEAERLVLEAFTMGGRVARDAATPIFGVQMFVLRGEQGRLPELEDGVKTFVDRYPTTPGWRAGLAYVYCELGRTIEARREFEHLAAKGLQAMTRDPDWLIAVVLLAQVCAFLGDAERARELYDLLLPYGGRNVVLADMAACLGSASRSLGMLAATMGRWDDAAGHFEDALSMNAKMGARPYVAHTQREYAAVLLKRDRPGDPDRAHTLLSHAIATYEALGMTSYGERAAALLAVSAPPIAEARNPQPAANTFRRETDYWTIAYDGKVLRLKDAKGLRYVARLLQHPGREFHVADLLTMTEGGATGREAKLADGLRASRPQPSDTLPDARARTAYQRRLRELQDELEEAEQFNDTGRAGRAQDEIEQITGELTAAYGFAGKARASNEPIEKLRKAVTNRIRDQLAKIRTVHPTLGQHLGNSLKTGTFCTYEPEKPTDWEVSGF
jgi:tetratricopeptide (TPR) repeat protein